MKNRFRTAITTITLLTNLEVEEKGGDPQGEKRLEQRKAQN